MSADRWVLVPVSVQENIGRWLRLLENGAVTDDYWANGQFQADCRDALTVLAAAPAAPAAESPQPQPLTDEQIDAALLPLYGGQPPYATHRIVDRLRARAAIAEFCRINGIGAPHD